MSAHFIPGKVVNEAFTTVDPSIHLRLGKLLPEHYRESRAVFLYTWIISTLKQTASLFQSQSQSQSHFQFLVSVPAFPSKHLTMSNLTGFMVEFIGNMFQ